MQKPTRLRGIETFGLSACASIISKTVTAPIDNIKLIITNQFAYKIISAEEMKQYKPYRGIVDCFTRVLSTEGPGPLWKGNMKNCLRYVPTQGLNFMFKEKLKFKQNETDKFTSRLSKNCCSGGVAGAVSLALVYSSSSARTKLANDVRGTGERQFNSVIDVYRKTIVSEGITGLYKGFAVSCVGAMVYRGFYFGLFDTLRPAMPSNNVFFIFGLAYVTTVMAAIISFPVDTVKRRTMLYQSNSRDCLSQILKNEGMNSLFRGVASSVVRSVLGAGTLACFDVFQRFYSEWKCCHKEED